MSVVRRWSMLGVGTAASAASAVTMHGAPFLIPAMRGELGLSLTQAGLVVAAPTVGVMVALIAWGAVVDRIGERVTLVVGLLLSAVGGALAAATTSATALAGALFLAGAAAASTNAASGRVVVGWFPPRRRGLAMGIRQTAQPIGVGVASLTLPVAADAAGLRGALVVLPVLSVVAAVACLLVVVDPPRPTRADAPEQAANPYRSGRFLWRVHGVSMLLVVPQFTVWTYTLVWLVDERGWSLAAAGTLVAVTQLLGALGRAAAGQLSDVVGSRTRPLRWVAVGAAAATAALGVTAGLDWAVSVPLVVLASVLSVADNGLAFTAVAERSGPFWSGRALGAQNTAQFVVASAVPPVMGAAITGLGYPVAFALAALAPVVAVPLVPVRSERPLS